MFFVVVPWVCLPEDLSNNRVNGLSPSLEMVSIRAKVLSSLLVEEEEEEEKIVGRSPILEGDGLHLREA